MFKVKTIVFLPIVSCVTLPAEVVGATGHVGQRADKVVTALKGGAEEHGADLLHSLHRDRKWSVCSCLIWLFSFVCFLTIKTWTSKALQGDGKEEPTGGHVFWWGSISIQLFPNISTSWVRRPTKKHSYCLIKPELCMDAFLQTPSVVLLNSPFSLGKKYLYLYLSSRKTKCHF